MSVTDYPPREEANEHVTLPDGRKLAFDDYGVRQGPAVLYFHGVLSCRVEWRALTTPGLAEKNGVRLIAIDRPECGRSDFQPRRKITDWPKDVEAFVRKLGIGRFAVLGYSGGGAYALAVSAFLEKMVGAVAVVSCVAPHDVPGLTKDINPDSLRFMQLAIQRPKSIDLLFECSPSAIG